MAIPILPYSVEHYNSLPELCEAEDQFKSSGASEILFTEIGPALVRHHVENILGVVLLHNHFLLNQNEKLVDVGHVAIPCAEELPNVSASSWRFIDEGIAPYEFVRSATETSLAQMEPFLAEFRTIINKRSLDHVFGICSLKEESIDGPVTTEFTSGRANITLPFDITPNDGNLVDAMWQFSSAPPSSSTPMASSKSKDELCLTRVISSEPSRLMFIDMPPTVFAQCKLRCKGKPHSKRHLKT